MTQERKQRGSRAEDLAVEFLRRRGYRILERNFKLKLGEIDIIAEDQDTLCFVEVRAKAEGGLVSPLESITPSKQQKLSKLALAYLRSRYRSLDVRSRFDVVGVIFDEQGKESVDIVQNAFELWSGFY